MSTSRTRPATHGKSSREEKSSNSTVTVKIKSQDGREFHFKIRRDTVMTKLFNTYCNEAKVDRKTVQFLYNSERVKGHETPNKLGMEDKDEIDCMGIQGGGGGFGVHDHVKYTIGALTVPGACFGVY